MKKIIVACGAGVATSTIAIQKIKAGLEKRGLLDKVQIAQSTVVELSKEASKYDLVVSTAMTSEDYGVPLIKGLPFITGMGVDKVMDEIVEKLEL
ncbi:MAG: PTS sugar transporter subunit IIB [Clostridium sp.]|uniref:PTS sugar transporter subunit IIB n=1 Tax=Clostridium sp. TaxID=1506 RepID=UPI0025C695EB|nr:PTS sugar transporter subunit IIB [Clostridium sp.]MCF0148240.1 PTS sugar transporter subunit IIB [Clostridium sp.]